MKASLSLLLAAALAVSGCSAFQRSPVWESVVNSRAQYTGAEATDAKDGYLNHLHQILRAAGVAHKLVTYEFTFHDPYREVGVQTASAILYRDETTPRNPWWIMDEYHHVPVWLPNWDVRGQLEFFTQRPVQVISVKDYAGSGEALSRDAKVERPPRRMAAHTAREKKFRALFTFANAPSKGEKPGKVPTRNAAPLAAAGDLPDFRAAALFRSEHGTQFDPSSSVDRTKMNELRRQLLNRTPRISLRTQ
jgi:hypothetical protein